MRRRWRKTDVILGKDEDGNKLWLREEARKKHMHVLGLSDKGKSRFLEGLIRQDIINGHGLCLIDPHQSLYDAVLAWCAKYRRDDRRKIRLLNPLEDKWCMGFNPLHVPTGHEVSGRVDAVIEAVSRAWAEDSLQKPLLQKCLRAIFYVLAHNGLTFVEAIELMDGKDPAGVHAHLTNGLPARVTQKVWDVFNKASSREYREQFGSSWSRMTAFLDSPVTQAILGQRSGIDFYRCMEEGDIVLINLKAKTSKGFSRGDAALLGTLLVNELFHAAQDREPDVSRPFFLYIDECHRYVNEDIESILDENRKFGLHAILAHQRIDQLRRSGESVMSGVINGAQVKVMFGLGHDDALEAAKHVFAVSYNLDETKSVLDRETIIGQRKARRFSGGSSTTITDTENWSDSTGENAGSGEVRNDDGDQVTEHETSGNSSQSSRGGASSVAHQENSGWHEVDENIWGKRPSATVTLEEHKHRAAVQIMQLMPRQAIVKIPGKATAHRITTDFIEPAFLNPRRAQERSQQFIARVCGADEYTQNRKVIEDELLGRPRLLQLEAAAARIEKQRAEEEVDPPDFRS